MLGSSTPASAANVLRAPAPAPHNGSKKVHQRCARSPIHAMSFSSLLLLSLIFHFFFSWCDEVPLPVLGQPPVLSAVPVRPPVNSYVTFGPKSFTFANDSSATLELDVTSSVDATNVKLTIAARKESGAVEANIAQCGGTSSGGGGGGDGGSQYSKSASIVPPNLGWGSYPSTLALSRDGSTLVVGDNSQNEGTGQAWIYRRGDLVGSADEWALVFTATGPTKNKNWARSTTISSDGSYVVVGGHEARVARVYFRNPTTGAYALQTELTGSSDYFGFEVSITADGSLLAVSDIVLNGGCVNMFSRSGTTWTKGSVCLRGGGSEFGTTVALSGDGSSLAAFGQWGGGAWVFRRTGDTSFAAVQQLAATDGGGSNFGDGMSFSHDGSILAVGDPSEYTNSGALFIFKRQADGKYAQLQPKSGPGDQWYGQTNTVSADGNLIAQGGGSGRTPVTWYRRNPATGLYAQEGKLPLSWDEPACTFASLNSDGSMMAVGCPRDYEGFAPAALYIISFQCALSQMINVRAGETQRVRFALAPPSLGADSYRTYYPTVTHALATKGAWAGPGDADWTYTKRTQNGVIATASPTRTPDGSYADATYNYREDVEPEGRLPYCTVSGGKIWVGVSILPNTPSDWTLSVYTSMPATSTTVSKGATFTFPKPLLPGRRLVAIDPPPIWQTAVSIAGVAWNLITANWALKDAAGGDLSSQRASVWLPAPTQGVCYLKKDAQIWPPFPPLDQLRIAPVTDELDGFAGQDPAGQNWCNLRLDTLRLRVELPPGLGADTPATLNLYRSRSGIMLLVASRPLSAAVATFTLDWQLGSEESALLSDLDGVHAVVQTPDPLAWFNNSVLRSNVIPLCKVDKTDPVQVERVIRPTVTGNCSFVRRLPRYTSLSSGDPFPLANIAGTRNLLANCIISRAYDVHSNASAYLRMAIQRRPIGLATANSDWLSGRWYWASSVLFPNQTLTLQLLTSMPALEPDYEYRVGFTRQNWARLPWLGGQDSALIQWVATFFYAAANSSHALQQSPKLSNDVDGCRTDATCYSSNCVRQDSSEVTPVPLPNAAQQAFPFDWEAQPASLNPAPYTPHRGWLDTPDSAWVSTGVSDRMAERWITGPSEAGLYSARPPVFNITLPYLLPYRCNPLYVQFWISKIAPGLSGRTAAGNALQTCYAGNSDSTPEWNPHVVWHSEWQPVESWQSDALAEDISTLFTSVQLPSWEVLKQVNGVVDEFYSGLQSGSALYLNARVRNWDEQVRVDDSFYSANGGIFGGKFPSATVEFGCTSRLAFHWETDFAPGGVIVPLDNGNSVLDGELWSTAQPDGQHLQINTTSDLIAGIYAYKWNVFAHTSVTDTVGALVGEKLVLAQASGFTSLATLPLNLASVADVFVPGESSLRIRLNTVSVSGLSGVSERVLRFDPSPPIFNGSLAVYAEQLGRCAGVGDSRIQYTSDLSQLKLCWEGSITDPDSGVASVEYMVQQRAVGDSWPSGFLTACGGDWLARPSGVVQELSCTLSNGYEYRVGLFARNRLGLPLAATDADKLPLVHWMAGTIVVDDTPPTVTQGQPAFLFVGTATDAVLDKLDAANGVPAALRARTRGPEQQDLYVGSLDALSVSANFSYVSAADGSLVSWEDEQSGLFAYTLSVGRGATPAAGSFRVARDAVRGRLPLAPLFDAELGALQQGETLYVHERVRNWAGLDGVLVTRSVVVDNTPPDVSGTSFRAVNPAFARAPDARIFFVEWPNSIRLKWDPAVDAESGISAYLVGVRGAEVNTAQWDAALRATYVPTSSGAFMVDPLQFAAAFNHSGSDFMLTLRAYNGALLSSDVSIAVRWGLPLPNVGGAVLRDRFWYDSTTSGTYNISWQNVTFLNVQPTHYTLSIGTLANPTLLLPSTVLDATISTYVVPGVALDSFPNCGTIYSFLIAHMQNSVLVHDVISPGVSVTTEPPAPGVALDGPLPAVPETKYDVDYMGDYSELTASWSGFTHDCAQLRYEVRLYAETEDGAELLKNVTAADPAYDYGTPLRSVTFAYPSLVPGRYLFEVCAYSTLVLSTCVRSDGVLYDPSVLSASGVTVYHGGSVDTVSSAQASAISVRAGWSGFVPPPSGIRGFRATVNTVASDSYGSGVSNWTDVGISTQAVLTGLHLTNYATYYVHVVAVTNAGVVSETAHSPSLLVVSEPLAAASFFTAPQLQTGTDGALLPALYAPSWPLLLQSTAVTEEASSTQEPLEFALGPTSGSLLYTRGFQPVVEGASVRAAVDAAVSGLPASTLTAPFFITVSARAVTDVSRVRSSLPVVLDSSAPQCEAAYSVLQLADGQIAKSAAVGNRSVLAQWRACEDAETPLVREEVALASDVTGSGEPDVAGWQAVGTVSPQVLRNVALNFTAAPPQGGVLYIWLRGTNAAGLSTLLVSGPVVVDFVPPRVSALRFPLAPAQVLSPGSGLQGTNLAQVSACLSGAERMLLQWDAFDAASGMLQYDVWLTAEDSGEPLLPQLSLPASERTLSLSATLAPLVQAGRVAQTYVRVHVRGLSNAGLASELSSLVYVGARPPQLGPQPLRMGSEPGRHSVASHDPTSLTAQLAGVFSGVVHELHYRIGTTASSAQFADWTPIAPLPGLGDAQLFNADGGVSLYGAVLELRGLGLPEGQPIVVTLRARLCTGQIAVASSAPLLVDTVPLAAPAAPPSLVGPLVELSSRTGLQELLTPRSRFNGRTYFAAPANGQSLSVELQLDAPFTDAVGVASLQLELLHESSDGDLTWPLEQSGADATAFPSMQSLTVNASRALVQVNPALLTEDACFRLVLQGTDFGSFTATANSSFCVLHNEPGFDAPADATINVTSALHATSTGIGIDSDSFVFFCQAAPQLVSLEWRSASDAASYVAFDAVCLSSSAALIDGSPDCDVAPPAYFALPDSNVALSHSFSRLNLASGAVVYAHVQSVNAAGLSNVAVSAPLLILSKTPALVSTGSSGYNSTNSSSVVTGTGSTLLNIEAASAYVRFAVQQSAAAAQGSAVVAVPAQDARLNVSWPALQPLLNDSRALGAALLVDWAVGVAADEQAADMQTAESLQDFTPLTAEEVNAQWVVLMVPQQLCLRAQFRRRYRVTLRFRTCAGLELRLQSDPFRIVSTGPSLGAVSLDSAVRVNAENEHLESFGFADVPLYVDSHMRMAAASGDSSSGGWQFSFGPFVESVSELSTYSVGVGSAPGVADVALLLREWRMDAAASSARVTAADGSSVQLSVWRPAPQSSLEQYTVRAEELAARLPAQRLLHVWVNASNSAGLWRVSSAALLLDDEGPSPVADARTVLESAEDEFADVSPATCITEEQNARFVALLAWSSATAVSNAGAVDNAVLAVRQAALSHYTVELLAFQPDEASSIADNTAAATLLCQPLVVASTVSGTHRLRVSRVLQSDSSASCQLQDGQLHHWRLRAVDVLGRESVASLSPAFAYARSGAALQALFASQLRSLAAPGFFSREQGNKLPVTFSLLESSNHSALAHVAAGAQYHIGAGPSDQSDRWLPLTAVGTAGAPLQCASSSDSAGRCSVPLPVDSDSEGHAVFVQLRALLSACGGASVWYSPVASVLDSSAPQLDRSEDGVTTSGTTVPALQLRDSLDSPSATLPYSTGASVDGSEDEWYLTPQRSHFVVSFQPFTDSGSGVAAYEWSLVNATLRKDQLQWSQLRLPDDTSAATSIIRGDVSEASAAAAATDLSSDELPLFFLRLNARSLVRTVVEQADSQFRAADVPLTRLAFVVEPSAGGLAAGRHVLRLRAINSAGLHSAELRAAVVVDDTPPLPASGVGGVSHGAWDPQRVLPTWVEQAQQSLTVLLADGMDGTGGFAATPETGAQLGVRVPSALRCQRSANLSASFAPWSDAESGGPNGQLLRYSWAVVQYYAGGSMARSLSSDGSASDSESFSANRTVVDELVAAALKTCSGNAPDGGINVTAAADGGGGGGDGGGAVMVARVLQCWQPVDSGTADRLPRFAASLLSPRLSVQYRPPLSLSPPLMAGARLSVWVSARNAAGLTAVQQAPAVTLLCGQPQVAAVDPDSGAVTLAPAVCLDEAAQLAHAQISCA